MCGQFIALLLGLLVAAGVVRADDSTAMLGAGGLRFTTTSKIRMAAEDLYLSPTAIRVKYQFVNDSDRDIDALIAFPLPDLDTWTFYEEPLGRMAADPVNFVSFSAQADGKPISFKVEQRAVYRGHDITARLNALGVPVNVLVNRGFEKLDTLTAAKKASLERAGLAERDAPDREHPKWLVRTRFYWVQRFPPHRTTVIEHSYEPVTGQALLGGAELNAETRAAAAYWKRTYCMDHATVAHLKAMLTARRSKQDASTLLKASSTKFILKTARNWHGPIGRFHLTLRKPKPADVVSLCWPSNLEQTSPTTFELTVQDLRPQHDIDFVVVE